MQQHQQMQPALQHGTSQNGQPCTGAPLQPGWLSAAHACRLIDYETFTCEAWQNWAVILNTVPDEQGASGVMQAWARSPGEGGWPALATGSGEEAMRLCWDKVNGAAIAARGQPGQE